MKKFEYLVKINIYESRLNELGKDGWELICIQRDYKTEKHHYFLKREIQ